MSEENKLACVFFPLTSVNISNQTFSLIMSALFGGLDWQSTTFKVLLALNLTTTQPTLIRPIQNT